MKLQGEESSMQDQQTCATMRSDCPQKAETENKGKRKTNKNKMPSQEKQIPVDVSYENKVEKKETMLAHRCYTYRRISSVCQTETC